MREDNRVALRIVPTKIEGCLAFSGIFCLVWDHVSRQELEPCCDASLCAVSDLVLGVKMRARL